MSHEGAGFRSFLSLVLWWVSLAETGEEVYHWCCRRVTSRRRPFRVSVMSLRSAFVTAVSAVASWQCGWCRSRWAVGASTGGWVRVGGAAVAQQAPIACSSLDAVVSSVGQASWMEGLSLDISETQMAIDDPNYAWRQDPAAQGGKE